MHVPLINLRRLYEDLKPDIDAAIGSVLNSGRFILGDVVAQLEQTLAHYVGTSYALGVASGTDALLLALRVIGVGQGDFVITTTFTFFATPEVIIRLGATPIFVDIEPQTYNMDPEHLDIVIKHLPPSVRSRLKAIIPVHLYGQSADMDEIMGIATKYGVPVVEDLAQALGAEYKGKKVGSFGLLGGVSFFPTKNLPAFGDAGMIFTDDSTLYEKIKTYRIHGATKKYYYPDWGYNSRLDAIQAAILSVNFKHLEEWNERRKAIAAKYDAKLHGVVETPAKKHDRTHIYHQYTIRTPERDNLRKFLQEKGIETAIHYPIPCHLQPALSYLGYRGGDLPVSEKVSKEVLSLPIFQYLSEDEVDYVIDTIIGFFR